MSNINPNNINGTYPIAGQDNSSQGFRDNFTNIKNNLTFARDEIADLQSKVVLKAPLQGTALNNSLGNQPLIGAQIRRQTETIDNIGLISGSVEINWTDAHFQQFETDGSVTLEFTEWPESGFYTTIRVLIDVADPGHTITLPAEVTIGLDRIAEATGQVITHGAAGWQMYEFSTFDGGNSIIIRDLLN